jgi:hypothetical protein
VPSPSWWFLERTPYGAIVKAGAHDSEMVRALGIDLARVRNLVFALGTFMAGIAGVIAAPMWSLKPTIGAEAVMPAFIVVVIGGIGSFWGAILGGLMVGLASGLSNLVVPRGSILVMYLLLAVVLLWRPRGLMPKSMLETNAIIPASGPFTLACSPCSSSCRRFSLIWPPPGHGGHDLEPSSPWATTAARPYRSPGSVTGVLRPERLLLGISQKW